MRVPPGLPRPRLILGIVVLVMGWTAPPCRAQDSAESEEPVPPWELARPEPGEPYWAGLLKLREAEPRYRNTAWWNAYAQMRAHVEAEVGNHAAALAAWDSGTAPPDSVSVVPPGIEALDALAYLSAVADSAQVIMVNERHHAASDRLLTLELLPRLWDKGYRYLAAEAFNVDDEDLNVRAYPVQASGVYLRDPVFAAIVREALRLGYTLVPYESKGDDEVGDPELTPQQRRDLGQARNLARAIFDEHPKAKVLVHAGWSHVLEKASERFSPMAVYFRELTGIDPVTVDQTRMSERSVPAYEHPAYRACLAAGLLEDGPVVLTDETGRPWSPAEFAVDLQVFTPRSVYAQGRPEWMSLGGRRRSVSLPVPEGEHRWCLVEARVAGEPREAIPLDRAEVHATDRARLFLPLEGDLVLRVLAADGSELRTLEIP